MPIEFLSAENQAQKVGYWQYEEDINLAEMIEVRSGKNGERIAEFIGTDNFGVEFVTRQEFEVDAGRGEVPLLYQPIYSIVENSGLPKLIDVDTLGPGGFVFEEVLEGGEVKLASMESSEHSVRIRHWAVGLEYSEDIFIYNQQWRLAPIERGVGKAHNALLNNIHLYPIISQSYSAGNTTSASAVGATLEEKYLRTLEDAITEAKMDTTNPRPGPYALLVSSANLFTLQRALTRVSQVGFGLQSNAIESIRTVIAYDGWSGTRGLRSTTYTGVAANTAYLISLDSKELDFQSFVKHNLRRIDGEVDRSRFILGSDIWDVRLGVYLNPVRAVQKITLPT